MIAFGFWLLAFSQQPIANDMAISEEQVKSSIVHRSSFLVDTDSLHEHPMAKEVMIPLSTEDWLRLRESIQRYGIRVPLSILRNGTVLDGHHRLEIAQELGIPHVPVQVLDLAEERDQLVWMIRANLDRRQLTEGQRAVMAKRLYELEQRRASERRAQAPGLPLGTKKSHVENFPQQGRARELAAQTVGISGRTLEKVIQAIKREPSLEEPLRKGEISVHRAYTMAKAKEDSRRISKEGSEMKSDMTRTCFMLSKEEYNKLKAIAHEKLLPLPKLLRQLVRMYLNLHWDEACRFDRL